MKHESRMYWPACAVDVGHVVVAANVSIHGLDALLTYWNMVLGLACGMTT